MHEATLFKNCKFIVTQNEKREILENCDILIDKGSGRGVITKIGKNLKVSGRLNKINKNNSDKSNKVHQIDCSNKIVMPGLINCHTHLAMTALRGIADDLELDEWLSKYILPAEHKMTSAERYQGAVQGIKECLKFGTTTVCDMYYPVEETIKAVKKAGIRAVITPTVGDSIRYYNIQEIDNIQEAENKTAKLSKSLKQDLKSDYLRSDLKVDKLNSSKLIILGIAPHSVYACSEKLLKLCARYEGIKHIHLAETRKERVDLYKKTKMLPVQYLDSLELLDEKTILAHSIWLTKGELRLIAERGAKVVHCPTSNMKLASGGVMPLIEMQEYGIIVGLGTDSAVSNNSLDMFREMRECALLHKQHRWDPRAARAQKVLDMATTDGAKVLGIENLGAIKEGWKADIITLNIDINLQPAKKERIVSHLVYSAVGFNVCDVIVDGEIIKYSKGNK